MTSISRRSPTKTCSTSCGHSRNQRPATSTTSQTGTSSMSETMPLVELAGSREVNRVSGLEAMIRDLHRSSALQDAYAASVPRAARRPERDKDFFLPHSGTVAGPSNRIEEHLVIALVNDDVTIEVDEERIRLLDYQVPLKARQGDSSAGKCDLVGYGADGRLWVIELKVRTGTGRGDTPLRALIEALTYSAVLEANWPALASEVSDRFGLDVTGERPQIAVTVTSRYWEGWHTSPASGDWLKALDELGVSLEADRGRRIVFLEIGDIAPLVVDGVPSVPGNVEFGLVTSGPGG